MDIELSNGTSFYTTYKGFGITDEWGQYKVTHIGPLESNAPTFSSTCPMNMIYGTCTCQVTCEDPDGQSGCNNDCFGTEGCTCPAGFLMQGSDCISASECGCFVAEANLVIPSGQTYVNDDCTQKCSCNDNQLTCAAYSCSTNAVCDVRDGVRQCYCNEGYDGDGENCPPSESYRDCQDVYDADHRQDGVYTIMPTGWPGLPFDVNCKMENGGGWTVINSLYKGKQFSTHDRDNDAAIPSTAQRHKSGWWHLIILLYCYSYAIVIISNKQQLPVICTLDNLNGVYNGATEK
ncbi:putative zonadhesin-like [Apostichopus japonicus]|uniref:Putative zonadhesin-like n=1 Tax=Stichopus japonicus TaxID=307972 RepID=A0A2G8KY99_STIJA|nr:putative zonadhesin-like [Apostichopus japonicus]